MKMEVSRPIRVLLAVVMLLFLPTMTRATTHTITPLPLAESPMGVTYHLDWSSLAAAGADTGFAYFDLVGEQLKLKNTLGINSSGQGVLSLAMSAIFAASIDSERVQIDYGYITGGTFIPTHTFSGSTGGANATLLTATTPYFTVTSVPYMAGILRVMAKNVDATTAGLIDNYLTFIKRGMSSP